MFMTKEERKEYMKEYRKTYIRDKEKKKKWFTENKEKVKEYRKKWQDQNKDYIKEYYIKNKDKITELQKEYKVNNKDKIKKYHKKYIINKDKVKEYKERNKDRIREYNRQYVINKRNSDPLYKLKHNIRTSIRRAITKQGFTKNSKTSDILGCSYDEIKTYLESKFESWMTWENYGLYEKDKYNVGWDIDHIIPLNSAMTEDEIIKLNHYTNLQPLCSKVNRDEKRGS